MNWNLKTTGKIFTLLFAIFLFSPMLNAAPYHGEIKKFKQPDGASVDVKLYGTEFYMRAESLDGYTLVRDKASNWICYARLSEDQSELVSSGIAYHGVQGVLGSLKTDLMWPKHLDIQSPYRDKIIAKNQKQAGLDKISTSTAKTAPHIVAGSIKGLCVVIDFPDEPGTLPMSEFENFCNNLSYSNNGNNGSLRKTYFDYSGGLVDYQNVVYGYYRAPLTFAHYDSLPYATGAQQVLGLALNWVASLGFDFSTLSTNPDGSIMAINMMFTGNPPNWAQGMWWHQGYYDSFSANGVHSGAYNCSPANDPLVLSVVAHENGHMIGKWPDTYKYTSDTGPDGIGSFDLMCDYGDSYNPVPPNPHFLSNAGWCNVVDVTYFNGLISDTANTLTIYKYTNPNDTNEFFLLKNRMPSGRSTAIPDQGLTIWHIDRNGDNQTTHHETYLVHANNDVENHNDACFHQGFNPEFGASTTPNSNYFNDNPSALRVWDISNTGDVMTYKIGAGQPAPSFLLQYINYSNDPNANGYLEPSESGDLNVHVSNLGQLNSGSATVTCAATGANASYVTIGNPSVTAGVINVNQSVTAVFNISIASNTPVGTLIDFKFSITDGAITTYITKQLMVGQQIVIGESPTATCSAVFLDNGGSMANYPNNVDYSTTLTAPANSKVKVQFMEFDLEGSTNCAYDYLKIYNGANTSAPLLGSFCGTTSPGTVVASNATGSLTFRFHADEGVTGTGWKAIVTCEPVAAIAENDRNPMFSISPNPFNDQTLITISDGYSGKVSVKIFDLVGNMVFEKQDFNGGSFTLSKSELGAGAYFVQLSDENQRTHVRKMVVY